MRTYRLIGIMEAGMRTIPVIVGLAILSILVGCDDRASTKRPLPSGGSARTLDPDPAPYEVRPPERPLDKPWDWRYEASPAAKLSLEDTLKEVEHLHALEGSAVTYSGVLGEFFALSKVIIDDGTGETFTELLQHENPVARAMGLLCLTQTERQGAVDVLRAHLKDNVGDSDLDENSRLAAASALTRFTSEESARILEEHESVLNTLTGQALGTRFVATLTERRQHERRVHALREEDWQYGRRDRHALLLEMCECRHPLALDDLVAAYDEADPQVREAIADYLIGVAQNIETYQAPWDTYSNVAFHLSAACKSHNGYPFNRREIPGAARDLIRQCIEPYIGSQM
jgi:hypothetical protein